MKTFLKKQTDEDSSEGVLLVNKPKDRTSFSLVSALRRHLNIRKIGHAGTLDPFATGVMVMLIGKKYTTLSDQFMASDKEYLAEIILGVSTDTFDCDGEPTATSSYIPSLMEIEQLLRNFQGEREQIPPMFSAKKIKGKKLYNLARKGICVERTAIKIELETILISYQYPRLNLKIKCSKGTYIRAIANDLGQMLHCEAHLHTLQRTRSGNFYLEDCLDGAILFSDCAKKPIKQSLQVIQ